MDFSAILLQVQDFGIFLSNTYGSGNALADGLVALGSLVVVFVIFTMLGSYCFAGKRSDKEVKRLDFISSVLQEMSLQVTEMNSLMLQEFQKCRGELGSLKQEVIEMRHTINYRPSVSRSEERSVRQPTSFGATGNSGFPSLKGLSF